MSDEIRRLPGQEPRVETGPVQFGDDWPGIFIRGDNAIGYVQALRHVLADPGVPIFRQQVQGLIRMLEESNLSKRREASHEETEQRLRARLEDLETQQDAIAEAILKIEEELRMIERRRS